VEDLRTPTSTDDLVAALADVLRAHGRRMATAESCTGGLIAGVCTELPGSSDWFEGGVVSYSNAAKHALLGVPLAALASHGAVSEPVALAMAEGVLVRLAADLAVAVTGIAGPGGGSPRKPVGTVWIAFAQRLGSGRVQTSATCHHFGGDRAQVRAATVVAALQGLLQHAKRGA
jgi:nicotinamide-nucleotide amidase